MKFIKCEITIDNQISLLFERHFQLQFFTELKFTPLTDRDRNK